MKDREELLSVLSTLCNKIRKTETIWAVGGSSGLLLHGVRLDKKPGDIDLYADTETANEIHQRLLNISIDQPVFSRTEIYESCLSHYYLDGQTIELVAGFKINSHGSIYSVNMDKELLPYTSMFAAAGSSRFLLMPLAHELVFNVLRDRPDRYERIAEAMAVSPDKHEECLRMIIEQHFFSPLHLKKIAHLATIANMQLTI